MRKGSSEQLVRRNITLPDSFIKRLDSLKESVGAASDSEIIRQALRLYEAVHRKDTEVVLRNTETGKETTVLLP